MDYRRMGKNKKRIKGVKMKDHIDVDTSNLSSEELGKTIDEAMAKEDILLLDNSSCGYKAYLIPSNLMEFEDLLNLLKLEPMIKPMKNQAHLFQEALKNLQDMFGSKK